jgi:hypothetical protein
MRTAFTYDQREGEKSREVTKTEFFIQPGIDNAGGGGSYTWFTILSIEN